jgi:hypothetical protein
LKIKATATHINGQKIKGYLTTEHAASSYGQPVFVDADNQAYNWSEIEDIMTTEGQRKGGKATSEAKRQAARENGRKGGRPRKSKP